MTITYDTIGIEGGEGFYIQTTSSPSLTMTVDWGDGTVDTFGYSTSYTTTHTYSASGIYTATVSLDDVTAVNYLDLSSNGFMPNILKL